MGYLDRTLEPQETVLWRGKDHWLVALAWPLRFVAAGALFIVFGSNEPATLLILLAVVVLPFVLLGWLSQDYALTNRRVIRKKGLIGRNVQEVALTQVESVNLHQSAISRPLGYGSVTLTGTGGTLLALKDVSRPAQLREATVGQLAQLRLIPAAPV